MGVRFEEGVTVQAPVNSTERTYASLIQQYLGLFLHDNATFLAERMVASFPNSTQAVHLLGVCYFRQGKPQRARAILENSTSPQSLYLLAQCQYELEEYGLAEEVLLRQARLDFRKLDSNTANVYDGQKGLNKFILTATPCPIPNGAAGLHLLGQICRKNHRRDRSIQYFRMAVQLDPLMWSSFEALCELGDKDLDPTVAFGVSPELPDKAEIQRGSVSPGVSFGARTPYQGSSSVLQPMEIGTPSVSTTLPKTSLFHSANRSLFTTAPRNHEPKSSAVFETPNLTPIPNEQSFVESAKVVKRARKVATRKYYEPSPEITPILQQNKGRSLFLGGLEDEDDDEEENTKTTAFSATAEQTGKTLFSTSKPLNSTPKPAEQPVVDEEKPARGDVSDENSGEGVNEILKLLSVMGAGQVRLSQYRSKEALEIFKCLPEKHMNTGWVLHQIGRAYFEMADYQNSIRVLQIMEKLEPHRMQGLEVLSTALWQMKREVDLSYLAQRVSDFDRESAEVWCVVGNCFSLQKEHETALTFFRRSIQLDPSLPYSHTLCGHEYFSNEDFEKAIACYRDAIRADDRHYNAWYGIGAVYHRQEKFDFAEHHFQKACSINPQSSVLICHLGMAQNANGKPYEALDTLNKAFRIDPRNPQAHYQRALVYQSLNRNQEALIELNKVCDAAPREAQIHFSIGRVHKQMGQTEKAMRCFLNALDLDPKDTNLIKAAMEKMDEPDIEEEISDF